MYCPSVRQSTPASRSSAKGFTEACFKHAVLIRTVHHFGARCAIVHTCHGAEYLLFSLSQSQHDGCLGEHCGVDAFSMFKDAQRLVEVCSGVPHMSGKSGALIVSKDLAHDFHLVADVGYACSSKR